MWWNLASLNCDEHSVVKSYSFPYLVLYLKCIACIYNVYYCESWRNDIFIKGIDVKVENQKYLMVLKIDLVQISLSTFKISIAIYSGLDQIANNRRIWIEHIIY